MQSIARTLIAATLLTMSSATLVCVQGTNSYGTGYSCGYGAGYGSNWSDTSSGKSSIMNGQVTLQTQWSNLNTVVDSVGGDVALQGAAAGNLVNIMTMNTAVLNTSQYVGPNAAIGSDINASLSNVWGSVGISNQALCN